MFAVCLTYQGLAQFGGRKSFDFLNVAPSARLAALGGVNVSLADRDLTFFMANPALAGDSLAGFASAGYQFYVADIGQAVLAYSHHFKKIGTLSFGVQHMNYGEITGYDASGFELGSFDSGETALFISKSHQVSNFRVGMNLKTVFSNIAGFRSSAVMVDLGGTFIHPTQELTIGLTFKNLGFVISEYSETSDTQVPFDVQAGATFKPEHMPLRFSLTAYNLSQPGNVYDNPDDENDDASSFDKLMSHITVGTEILFHRNVNVIIGYNFLRQQELRTEASGGTGFTIGASLKIKTMDIVMSRSSYSVGNAAYAFTVSTAIDNMIFRKRTL